MNLNQNYRGVPLWAWIAGGAVALYVVYRIRKANAKDADNEVAVAEGDYYGEGGGYLPVGGPSYGNALPEISADDLEGVQSAIASLGSSLEDIIAAGIGGVQDSIGGLTDAFDDIEWPDYPDLPEQPPAGGDNGSGTGNCPVGYVSDGKGNCVKKKKGGGGFGCPKGTTWDNARGGCVPITLPEGEQVEVIPPGKDKGKGKGKGKDKGKDFVRPESVDPYTKGPIPVTIGHGKGSLITAPAVSPPKLEGRPVVSVTGGGTVAPPPLRVDMEKVTQHATVKEPTRKAVIPTTVRPKR